MANTITSIYTEKADFTINNMDKVIIILYRMSPFFHVEECLHVEWRPSHDVAD